MTPVMQMPGWSGRCNYRIPLILLLWPCIALGQPGTGAEDLVYRNNGRMIHGTEAMTGADAGRVVRTRVDGQNLFLPDSGSRPVFSPPSRGWYNTTTLGTFLGDGHGFQLRTEVGYRFHGRYSAGIGAAVDQYTLRTVPVFAAFSADLLLRKSTPFGFADLGLANPWLRDRELEYPHTPYKSKPGTYLTLGLGQRIWGKRGDHSWIFAVGYSLETLTVRYTVRTNVPYPDPAEQSAEVQTFHYQFNRLVARLGITL